MNRFERAFAPTVAWIALFGFPTAVFIFVPFAQGIASMMAGALWLLALVMLISRHGREWERRDISGRSIRPAAAGNFGHARRNLVVTKTAAMGQTANPKQGMSAIDRENHRIKTD